MKIKLIDKHPEVANEWHPNKNKGLDLRFVSYGSRKKVWWLGKCGHEYQARVDARTGRKSGCPYCNRGKKIHPITITHPNLVAEWHLKNGFTPEKITAGQNIKVWWLGKCGHEWQAYLHNRTKEVKPAHCPYCCNKTVHKTNCLATVFPEVASEWHPLKNCNLNPNKVTCRSKSKVWWLGKCGHEWETCVYIRTREKRPSGCPFCQESKGELSIKLVLERLSLKYISQARFAECRDLRPLPFDFFLEDKKILIEYQGIQHYEPINFGGDYKKIFDTLVKHDRIKSGWCKSNNYKLIVIPYYQFDEIDNIIKGGVKSLEI